MFFFQNLNSEKFGGTYQITIVSAISCCVFFCTCGLFPNKQNQVDVNVLVKHIFSYTDPQGRHFWLCNMSIVSNENHMKSYTNLILNISHIFFQTTKNNSSQSHEKKYHISTDQGLPKITAQLWGTTPTPTACMSSCTPGSHILKASGRVIIRLITSPIETYSPEV